MLTSINLTNYRGFRSLNLEGLQSVNLIVGKNNSGKTSLLEAIAILLNPMAAPGQIVQLRESKIGFGGFHQGHYSSWVIHNDSPIKATLTGQWSDQLREVTLVPHPHQQEIVSLEDSVKPKPIVRPNQPQGQIASTVVSTDREDPSQLVNTFGNAVRKRNGEESIETLLNSVDPRIRKVRIDPTQQGNRIVIDTGLRELVPLSQLGQGIGRLIEVFAEIIGSGAQVCFIDEIENGVHHSSLLEVWTGLAEASDLFNVQIFATTHSHECIEAAHAAFSRRANYKLSVIQLFRESETAQGRVLDKNHIAAGIAGEIDLRG